MDKQGTMHKLYKTYKHVDWLLTHLDLYQMNEKGRGLCDKLVRYGGNYYTYPFEAETAYVNFRTHVWNNPFLYQTTALEMLGAETEYCIFATSIDGYFIDYREAEETYVLPIGFIRDVLGEKDNITIFQNEIAKMIREFHTQKGLIEQKFQSGINKCQQCEVDVMKQRLGKLFVEKNMNKLVLLEKQFDSSNTVTTVILVVLFILYLFCIRHIVNNQKVFKIAGAMIGVYNFWLIFRMLQMRFYVKRIRKNIAKINDYWQSYRNMSMLGINFDSIFVKKEKESVKPRHLVAQYLEVGNILEANDILANKKMRIHHRYWDYFVIFIGVILIAIMLLSGGIISSGRNVGESSDSTAKVVEESPETNKETLQEEISEQETEIINVFDSNGFIFADSDSRYLTDSEVYALKEIEGYEFQDLLGFARNEIYARHGYPFNEAGKYYPFYMQYSWYSGISHQVVGDADLNTCEKANIKLIVQIESEYGYR